MSIELRRGFGLSGLSYGMHKLAMRESISSGKDMGTISEKQVTPRFNGVPAFILARSYTSPGVYMLSGSNSRRNGWIVVAVYRN